MTPEPKDKLDAMTTQLATAPVAVGSVGMVNGPEDSVTDWSSINWRTVGDEVGRLRQRIFAATQAGDLKRVRNLQKLMLRSRANALSSVRRVTEINAGRGTAGVDGQVVLLPVQRPNWRTGCNTIEQSGPFSPSSVCSSRRPTESCARSAFPSSLTAPSRRWSPPRWNPNGRHGSSRSPMASARAVAVTTRSAPSIPR